MTATRPNAKRRQTGFAFLQIIAMLGIGAALVGMIGYGFVSLTRTGAIVASKSQASDSLTQAKNTVVINASDTDSDGVYEPAVMYTAAANCSTSTSVCPTGGGQLPLTLSPRTDAWGTPFGYCSWDNGSTYASANRINGDSTGTNTSNTLAFAIISAGPDKVFQTTCAGIKTAVVASYGGTATPFASGDDGVRAITQLQMIQGVGGTVYYGDPVSTSSLLPTTGNMAGSMRMALDTSIVYVWNGTAWQPVNSSSAAITATAGSDCSAYPLGSLGRDIASGDLLICHQ